MRSWSTFKQISSWNKLQDKPPILSDNQISWSELINKPTNLTFFTDTAPGNWQPWVLSSYYGNYLEWIPLTSVANPWTMVQRGGNGNITATTFRATNIATTPPSNIGDFYRDANGFVKVVF